MCADWVAQSWPKIDHGHYRKTIGVNTTKTPAQHLEAVSKLHEDGPR